VEWLALENEAAIFSMVLSGMRVIREERGEFLVLGVRFWGDYSSGETLGAFRVMCASCDAMQHGRRTGIQS